MKIFGVLFFCGVMSSPWVAEARLFDLNNESFASYLTLGYSTSAAKDSLFADESNAVSFSKNLASLTGGEFGFLRRTDRVSWRFGLEILKPAALKDVEASDASDQVLYKVDSEVMVVNPKFGIDFNFWTKTNSRFFVFTSVGSASVTVDQSYHALTVAPSTDFDSQWKGSGTAVTGGLGFEYGVVDLTSLVFEIGYRNLKISKLKYGEDITDLQGAQQQGGTVLLADGSNRTLDLSGWIANLSARWWLF